MTNWLIGDAVLLTTLAIVLWISWSRATGRATTPWGRSRRSRLFESDRAAFQRGRIVPSCPRYEQGDRVRHKASGKIGIIARARKEHEPGFVVCFDFDERAQVLPYEIEPYEVQVAPPREPDGPRYPM